jgi:hypothetical protein
MFESVYLHNTFVWKLQLKCEKFGNHFDSYTSKLILKVLKVASLLFPLHY